MRLSEEELLRKAKGEKPVRKDRKTRIKSRVIKAARIVSTPGPRGATGSTGATGATGAKGSPGSKGKLGETGPQGSEGERGLKGELGSPGSTGPRGDRGPKGDKGDEGFKGDSGERGDQGGEGKTGLPGVRGEPGQAGGKGVTGIPGPQGEVGLQGPTGKSGISVTGPQGETGDTGPRGDKGETGARGREGRGGPKGNRGDKGDEGRPGQFGLRGSEGKPGAPGASGSTGKQGPKGEKGGRGSEGKEGKQGKPAPPGPLETAGLFRRGGGGFVVKGKPQVDDLIVRLSSQRWGRISKTTLLADAVAAVEAEPTLELTGALTIKSDTIPAFAVQTAAGVRRFEALSGGVQGINLFVSNPAASKTIRIFVDGENSARANYKPGGLEWGPGGSDPIDVNLYRNAADELKTDDKFIIALDLDVGNDIIVGGLVDGFDIGAHGAAYNGSFIESMTFVVTSDGATITGTLDKDPTGDLTERFSDGYTTMSSGATVTLIAGSATIPKKNHVYVLQSNKGVLVASDSDWPATEHIRVAEVIVQTAALVASDGILANRNWNDFAQGTDGQGHHLHAWARLRWEHAAYKSGSAVTWSGSGTSALDLAISAGQIYQMHLHIDAAFDTTDPDNVYVPNHPTAYTATPDIETLVVDSGNVSLSNRYYNLVIWRSVSSGSEEEKVFINLPSGSYKKQSDAENDVSGFDNFTIPTDYRGYAHLIQRVTIKHSTAAGGTWTVLQETDLRGTVPSIAVGGGTLVITTEFADSAFKLFDEGDPTKLLVFQLSGITAGNTRTITMPDEDVTLVNLVQRTRKMPMNVVGDVSADDNLIRFLDGVTDLFAASTPVPSDWVSGTDITVHCLLHKGDVNAELAVLRSSISAKSGGETNSFNIENLANMDTIIPALSVTVEVSRTIAGANISAGEQLTWVMRRLGGDPGDALNETMFMRFGPWIEYTAFF